MKLRTLTLRGIPEPVLKAFRASAARNRRSLNAEVLVRLEAGAAAERAAQRAGEASSGPAASAAGVGEPAGQSYEVRRAFEEADRSRLLSDLALTPEQRVHLGEELAKVAASARPRPRFQRVIQFDRYEDYLDWKRFGDFAP
jgi:plasmid stability protein